MNPAVQLVDFSTEEDHLIEREESLAILARGARRAAEGHGGAVVLSGGKGLGKSSLIGALARLAEAEDMDGIMTRGRELEQDFDFGVVMALFESRLANLAPAERKRLFAGPAGESEPIFTSALRAAEGSFPLLHGLYWLVRNLAERRPLLLAVDDADLADAESLRFLLFLIERLDDLRVMIVLGCGAAIRPSDPDLLGQITRLRSVTDLTLRPFSAEASRRYVRTLLPDAPVEVCDAAHESAAGNPGLLRELVLDPLRETEGADATAASLEKTAPQSIADHALHRAAALATDAPVLVQAVAVLGDDADVRHVAGLARLDQAHTARLADELIAAGVLVGGERLRFAQPVVGRAVEASLSPSARAELHFGAAERLAAEEADPERVAAHLLSAQHSGDVWTVDVLLAAAARALDEAKPRTAVAFLRRALSEPPPPARRPEVVLELGRAEARAGEPEAVAHLTEAIERMGDPRQRAQTALVAGRTLVCQGRHRDARLAFERGLQELEARGDELSGRLTAALATIVHFQPGGRGGATATHNGESTTSDATPAGRSNLALLAIEAAFRGDPRERVVELAVGALARGALLTEETADGIAYYLACHALVTAEELGTAEAALTAAIEEAKARGSVLGLANASFFRSLAILSRGRINDAADDAGESLAAERHGWRLALPAVRSVLAETLVERGDLDGAGRQLDAALPLTAATPIRVTYLASRGHVALLSGEPAQAVADLLECGHLLEAVGARNPAVVAWRSSAARALAALGDQAEAERLAEEELALAERFGAPGAVGRAHRGLGAILEDSRGLEALEAAVERLEGSQAALERARALVDFGAALRRGGQRRAAREPLRQGLDLAERCGAEALARRAGQEAQLAGARPRRTAVDGREALTPRERQVADLAVEGLSNREISEALFVTVKTVEWHLRHAYRKLGVSTRSALRGALEDPSS
jgi:DNA-binding CsgD family transcriptional regulator